MGVPQWTAAGLLPPIRPELNNGADPDRSPYKSQIDDLVSRFGTTPERRILLDGLLRFRATIHELGMTNGFQWLDGSFMEDIETNGNRPPNDIDVVVFYTLPEGTEEAALVEANPDIFRNAKDAYSVDAYYYRLGLPMDQSAVERVSYWYSMWSHKRDHIWKGYIQVDLDPEHDAVARVNLNALLEEEVAHGIA